MEEVSEHRASNLVSEHVSEHEVDEHEVSKYACDL